MSYSIKITISYVESFITFWKKYVWLERFKYISFMIYLDQSKVKS